MSKLEQLLTQIAQSKLGIETLETRKSDSLDFHDVAVWCLRDALRPRSTQASSRAARRRSRTRPTTDQEPAKPSRKRLASLPNSAFITSPHQPLRRRSK